MRSLGADVCYYIPDRETEGYGMNMSAIDKIYSWGVGLIITVDNGIASFDEAEYIYSLGMSLVITDHHQIADGKIPHAEAVVNPHREENELGFREYCGVAVAFMLACAMNEEQGNSAESVINRYIDLVAIGTVADVMPLVFDNRAFVKKGLEKLKNNPPVALKPLLNVSPDKDITSTEIAFQICPRLNAMGRMGDAKRAVEFLLCTDSSRSTDACNMLNEENYLRQKYRAGNFAGCKKTDRSRQFFGFFSHYHCCRQGLPPRSYRYRLRSYYRALRQTVICYRYG